MKTNTSPSRNLLKLDMICLTAILFGVLCLSSFSKHAEAMSASASGIVKDNDSQYEFVSVADPAAYIEQEFSLAAEQGKRVLFILGSSWCHDSRSLAEKLGHESLSETLDKYYRVSMIDIGFLERGFEFTQLANMKTYYATPTVLIFDAYTRQLDNAANLHQWANAYQISQSDTRQYFQDYAQSSESNPTNQVLNLASSRETVRQAVNHKTLQLEAFVAKQEQRIKDAYLIIGPLLKAYKNNENPEDFEAYWGEVRALRMQLPNDIANIKKQILETPNLPIEFPDYPAFTWEAQSE